jgi:hypothetical protein
MADYELPALAQREPAAERCWMCGARLPVTQLVADGGSACGNLRWYCLDVHECTGRWTARAAGPDSGHGGRERTSPARAAGTLWS